MNKVVDSYVFSIFGRFDYISADDNQRLVKLREKIDASQLDLIVNAEEQVRMEFKIDPNVPPMPVQNVIRKPKVINKEESIRVAFSDDRIDVYLRVERNDDSELQTKLGFVKEFLCILKQIYGLRINRVAINVDNLFSDFSIEEATKIKNVFINTKIEKLKRNNLAEWAILIPVYEIVSDLGKINIVVHARRGMLKKNTADIARDLILIHYDINTEAATIEITESVDRLFDCLVEVYEGISTELDVVLSVEQ